MLNINFKTSQTLIELIISLGIAFIATSGILSLGISLLGSTGITSQKVMALNLTREGIEIVRAIRDSNRLNPASLWPYGLENGNWVVSYSSTSLQIPATSSNLEDCANCFLCQDGNGFLTPCFNENTLYKRMVSIEEVTPQEKKIVSEVLWTERGRKHRFSLELRLTNWR